MTHRIDAPMNAVQAQPGGTPSHRALAQTRAAQLAERHNTMLSRSDLRH